MSTTWNLIKFKCPQSGTDIKNVVYVIGYIIGKNKTQEGQKGDTNDFFGCTIQQKEILNRFIFWTLCSELKEGHFLLDIFLNNKLTLKESHLSEIHIMRKLHEGNLCTDDDFEESDQYRSISKELKEMEEEFLSSLSSCSKDKFDTITTNYKSLQSINSTDCFIHGFQYAAKMFMGIYLEYNK